MINLSSSGWRSGLREWILQRFTGIYIFLYFLFIALFVFLNNGFDYSIWINLFSSFYFKIFTLLFVFSIVLHSNIGLGIVLTDYIQNTILRLIVDFIINLILLAYIFFIMQTLWGFKLTYLNIRSMLLLLAQVELE